MFWKRSSRVGRVFEAHLLPVNQPLHGGPRRLGPPYEDFETSEVFRKPSILALATQGTGGDDENRLLSLLADFRPEVFAFDRGRKWGSFRQLIKSIFQLRPDLVVMEGTGLGGGLGPAHAGGALRRSARLPLRAEVRGS